MTLALTYAIGDIHGRADLLDEALALIAAHAADRRRRIIALGDLVDRGPESRAVVERLMSLQKAGRAECLKGNHEAMMLDALSNARAGAMDHWLDNGGGQTLASYAIRRGDIRAGDVPTEHLDWLAGLPFMAVDDHRIYVHAGLAPGLPLDAQEEAVCLWIREPFLRAPPGFFPAHVVHGHTPQWAKKPHLAEPERLAHRTNLDTGAYATGVLSIGVFDPGKPGGPLEILSTSAGMSGRTSRRPRGPNR